MTKTKQQNHLVRYSYEILKKKNTHNVGTISYKSLIKVDSLFLLYKYQLFLPKYVQLT